VRLDVHSSPNQQGSAAASCAVDDRFERPPGLNPHDWFGDIPIA
jgi:hypothetical protein